MLDWPTPVNAFLISINIPPMSTNSLMNREQEVGPAMEKLAKGDAKNIICCCREINGRCNKEYF